MEKCKSTSKRSSGAVSKFLSDRCPFVMGSSGGCLSLPPPVAGSQFCALPCQDEVSGPQGQDTEPHKAGGQRRVVVMGVPRWSHDPQEQEGYPAGFGNGDNAERGGW